MSLTAEQLARREGKLTASRITVLMKGDAVGILQLYREMIGEAVEENLDDVWPVQLGAATEKLNLDWYEKKNKHTINNRGTVSVSEKYPWAAATLDGWIMDLHCPIEAKNVGGREPLEIIIDRYQPQMQWQMMVTGAKQCALSVIMGANEPIVEYLERSQPYIDQMVDRGDYFMMCVSLRKPPVELAPVAPPVEANAEINMTGNATWSASAERWLQTYGAAQTAKDAEKVLKSLMPAVAKRCFGHGVRISRDRAGRLSLRVDE
jgi:predicted phage-related endonuclease